MLTSILILAISTGLFLYWFRYTCLLILSTKTSRDYTAEVAQNNRLESLKVQGSLEEANGAALDLLQRSLDRDYRMVSQLLRRTAELEVDGVSIEQAILRADFYGLKVLYAVSRYCSDRVARSALKEMTQIVAHSANAFGERLAAGARG